MPVRCILMEGVMELYNGSFPLLAAFTLSNWEKIFTGQLLTILTWGAIELLKTISDYVNVARWEFSSHSQSAWFSGSQINLLYNGSS